MHYDFPMKKIRPSLYSPEMAWLRQTLVGRRLELNPSLVLEEFCAKLEEQHSPMMI